MLIWNLAASYESLGDRLGHKFTPIGLHQSWGKEKNEEKRGEMTKARATIPLIFIGQPHG